MYTQITENVFTIDVKLPNSPLRNLNAYLIKGKDRNLLIDTGYRREECRDDLLTGLRELGVRLEETDIFATHMHADHTGLIGDILAPDCRAFMSKRDIQTSKSLSGQEYFDNTYRRMKNGGFPEAEITSSPFIRLESTDLHFDGYTPINEGDLLEYGGYRLRAISTPGHTPGHMCLYDSSRKLLFLGDHVLFDITPNITNWDDFNDPLGTYIKSLVRIRDIDAEFALPAHRTVSCPLPNRVDEIIEHHGLRVREVVKVIDSNPGLTPYEISARVSWNIRYDGNWENFPSIQKSFAVGEVQAHLGYLLERGRTICEERDGVHYFYPES